MRFFKLVEIDEREYIANTDDYAFEEYITSVNQGEDAVYVAVNEDCEDYLMVELEQIENREELKNG